MNLNSLSVLKTLITKQHPVFLHFGVTHKCNLNCRMCNLKNNNGVDMPLEQLEKCIRLIKELGIVSVSIGGGEPLLYQHILEAVRLFSDSGIEVRMLTNGTLVTKTKMRELKKAGLNHISISLDSLDEAKQDDICGREGTWNHIMEGVRIASQFFNRDNSISLINTVISKYNIEELLSLVDFAKAKGFYISFMPISSQTHVLGQTFTFQPQHYSKIDEVFSNLFKIKQKSDNNIFNSKRFLEITKQFLKNKNSNIPCDAGRLFYSLESNGWLYICHKKNSPGINLLNISSAEELKQYINSKSFKIRKDEFVESCPRCVRPCWTEVSLFFHNPSTFIERVGLHGSYYLRGLFR